MNKYINLLGRLIMASASIYIFVAAIGYILISQKFGIGLLLLSGVAFTIAIWWNDIVDEEQTK